MKKVALFLDIDGVLNSKQSKDSIFDKTYPIDEENVDSLLEIIEMIEVKGYQVDIIISSTWRIGKTIDMLQEILQPYGIEVANKTDRLYYSDRGTEIKKFMEQNEEYNHCIIFDDDIDMGRMSHFFIPVNAETGLRLTQKNSFEFRKDIETILQRPYHIWRTMDWIITSKELLGNISYYSNQPPKWITIQYYSWRQKNNKTYNSESFVQFVNENTTGLVMIPVIENIDKE